MPVFHLADLSWEDVDRLEGSTIVALLPTGAIEAHGPHLPLSTDVIIADAMAREGARLLAERGRTVLLLPALTFTAAGFAAAFSGTISVSAAVVTQTIVGIAESLAPHGIQLLALANAHFDPEHVAALEAGVREVAVRRVLTVAFPNTARQPWVSRLTEEFQSGACHAGRFETSIVMAERPALVRDAERRALPPNPLSLVDAIRAGHHTFAQAGGPRAYFGYPADATAAEGERTVQVLGGILAESVEAALAS